MNMIKSAFKEVKADWFKDLPVIDLSGKDDEVRVEVIRQCMRDCIVKVPLKIKLEADTDLGHIIESIYEFLDTSASVFCVYRPQADFAHIQIFYGKIPINRREVFYEMVNIINSRLNACHFKVHPLEHMVVVESGAFVTTCFNAQEFFVLLRFTLMTFTVYYPLLKELSNSGKSLMGIMKEFWKEMDDLKNQHPELF